jgi:twitching motility protein PilT
MALELNRLLEFAAKKGISDVHLKQGRPPALRIGGKLVLQGNVLPLKEEDMAAALDLLMADRHRQQLAQDGSADCAYELPGVARFRVNIFRQYTGVSIAFRTIPTEIKAIRDLSLPGVLDDVAREKRGLILVTGTTGSGKSTTLAALLNQINQDTAGHIITIEDPVEFVLPDGNCIINQREIGSSAVSFATALRGALRQDPDVIMMGEMRDRETIEIALQAAETGHLVLSTMHTIDAAETLNRAVAVFPPHDQEQIRHLFADVLRWVISQRLLPKVDGTGRVPAVEVLKNTPRMRELIIEQAGAREIAELIEKSTKVYRTQSFDQCLMVLYKRRQITLDVALENCSNPSDFKLKISGVS